MQNMHKTQHFCNTYSFNSIVKLSHATEIVAKLFCMGLGFKVDGQSIFVKRAPRGPVAFYLQRRFQSSQKEPHLRITYKLKVLQYIFVNKVLISLIKSLYLSIPIK